MDRAPSPGLLLRVGQPTVEHAPNTRTHHCIKSQKFVTLLGLFLEITFHENYNSTSHISFRRRPLVVFLTMVKGKQIPDAWEDDWESQADQVSREEDKPSPTDKANETITMTRSERLAKHAEAQRKLWEAACVKTFICLVRWADRWLTYPTASSRRRSFSLSQPATMCRWQQASNQP